MTLFVHIEDFELFDVYEKYVCALAAVFCHDRPVLCQLVSRFPRYCLRLYFMRGDDLFEFGRFLDEEGVKYQCVEVFDCGDFRKDGKPHLSQERLTLFQHPTTRRSEDTSDDAS